MKQPPIPEIVVRRGREFFEWRFREQNDSQFKTTKIPCYPICQKPARCKWCEGMQVGPLFLVFPLSAQLGTEGIRHIVTPPNGCHLTAIEFCELNPNQPISAGWILTDEEKMAGKKGQPWPEDI